MTKIRKINVKDLSRIDEIYVNGTIDEIKLQFPKNSKNKTLRDLNKTKKERLNNWKKDIKSRKNYWIIAENNGEIIGFGQSWIKRKNLGIVESVYTDRKHRKKGVGKKIVLELIKWLKKNHINNIETRVHLKNKPSIKLHKKLGFKPISLIMRFK